MGACCVGRTKDETHWSSVLSIIKTKARQGQAAGLQTFIRKVAKEESGCFKRAVRVAYFWPREGELIQVSVWESPSSLKRHKMSLRDWHKQELSGVAELPPAFDFEGALWRSYVRTAPMLGHFSRVVGYKLKEEEEAEEPSVGCMSQDTGFRAQVLARAWDLLVSPECAGDILVAAVAAMPSPLVLISWQVFESQDACTRYMEEVRPRLLEALDPVLDGPPFFSEQGHFKTLIPA
uniref:Uncharacterized protein n=1 Tax=Alexandrium catenella TaxID=2925 RepID=A0A7S1L542_ALECA